MKICMIIPPKVDGIWIAREDKHSGVSQHEFIPYTAPLIFALIHQFLPDAELELIEAQRDDLTIDQIKTEVLKINPDIIVTILSWTHIPWDRVCAEMDFPTITIIVQQYIDHKEAVELYKLKSKYFVKEEIEMPVVLGLQEFQRTGDIRKTKGFLIYSDNGIFDTGESDPADISKFPLPSFDVFEPEKYFELRESNPSIPKHLVRTAHFNTMKGCLFKCAYCGQANSGKRVRYQSPIQVIDQLEFYVKNHNVSNFVLYDNEFGIKIKRAKEICREIIRRRLDITYIVNNRVELFDDELISLMADSGCINVRMGIETCDPLLQKYLNKEIDLNRAGNVIKKLKNHGIKVTLYLIPGIPGETKESLRKSAKFISDVDANDFAVCPLFLQPNSPLYNKLKKSGKILESDWSEYRKQDKLSYVNESYENMDEILYARQYLLKKAYLYLFIKKLKRKEINIEDLYNSIVNTRLGRYLPLLIPRFIRTRFSHIVSSRKYYV